MGKGGAVGPISIACDPPIEPLYPTIASVGATLSVYGNIVYLGLSNPIVVIGTYVNELSAAAAVGSFAGSVVRLAVRAPEPMAVALEEVTLVPENGGVALNDPIGIDPPPTSGEYLVENGGERIGGVAIDTPLCLAFEDDSSLVCGI